MAVLTLLAVLTTGALAGCGNQASSNGSPAGTRIVSWLHTPPGAQLLGGAFPDPWGFNAVLRITGDPVGVFRHLVRQAKGNPRFLGVFSNDFDDKACHTTTKDPSHNWGLTPLTEDSEPNPDTRTLSCTGVAIGHETQLLTIWVGVAKDPPYHSFAKLSYSPHGDWDEDYDESTPQLEVPAVAAPFDPPKPVLGPGPGQPIAPGCRIRGKTMRVLAGSQMLAPAGYRCAKHVRDYTAVLEVTKGLDQVTQAYVNQFRAAGLRVDRRYRESNTFESASGRYYNLGRSGIDVTIWSMSPHNMPGSEPHKPFPAPETRGFLMIQLL
ncbi:MAG: hypothetical protein ACRDTQ_13235 [Micromonosporaceae bacterium]